MRLFRCESDHDLNPQGQPLDPNSPNVLEIGTYVLLSEGENYPLPLCEACNEFSRW